ncbi:MAG: hypothetical protein UT56_C0006G0011 [Candidatus Levybacteria bacterium GW2011_GWB1_39_7]|nr:MAG: hypothetical protein UT20_C0004G0013 [Candidatus Levybacteria bacterium GW2011_GWA1_39_11]KKR24914.1 MAG: hypothetical protein UT56_C0006G0011 [Candidatus Levybacteria bacterium GW2011_GWB1_39_7]KKR26557.1 MAG: hypothetical protein UT57_C0031G0003 [Microgenomates group bacterium GW2011_GWC1_39_7]KKR49940.1 MAG: hypothetical protein UT85_C0008G0011 [Candidatus Levybacteria bacterium GW2011_GWA2_40_16]
MRILRGKLYITVSKKHNSLEQQLKETQNLLGLPGRKIIETFAPILNRFNPLAKNGKNMAEIDKGRIMVQEHNNITWVNVENPTTKEMGKLSKEYGFHPLHLETVLLKSQPQIEREEKYAFLVFNIPIYDSVESKVLTDQISVFLGKNYLVTIHNGASSIHAQFNLCKTDASLRESFFKRSSGYLLYLLISNLIKDVEPLIQTISQELDEVEDIVFDVAVSGVHKISQLRQKVIRLKRILGSLKKILEDATPAINDLTSDNLSRYYGNITKTIDKLRDNIEEAKDTIEIYKDTDYIVSSDKTNEILAVLTIVFTLTIPATVIGTFYGMNIILPGGIGADSWNFWGQYTTFFVIVGISLILLLSMFLYFKFKKYF